MLVLPTGNNGTTTCIIEQYLARDKVSKNKLNESWVRVRVSNTIHLSGPTSIWHMTLISVNKRFRNQYYIFSPIHVKILKYTLSTMSDILFWNRLLHKVECFNLWRHVSLLLIKLLLLLYHHTRLLFSRCKPVFQVLIFASGLIQKTFLFPHAFCALRNSLFWSPPFSWCHRFQRARDLLFLKYGYW